jgi:hypothetical protein
MSKLIKELDELYKNYPKWIDALTTEEKHEWYNIAKEFVNRFKHTDDKMLELVNAIKNYEIRNGISDENS